MNTIDAKKQELMEFGDKLKRLRMNSGVTQDELADAIGFSRTVVARWEKGTKAELPDAETLHAMAKKLDIEVGKLFVIEEYTLEERTLLKDAKSIKYVKAALAKMKEDMVALDSLDTISTMHSKGSMLNTKGISKLR